LLTVAMLASAPSCAAGAGLAALALAGGSRDWCWRAAARPSASAATPLLLRLPLVGRLARGYNAARFGGTLAMLAGAGVPILKALQAAAETLGNRAMRADALDALVQVREGAPLASALAAKKRFPGPAGDVRAAGRADRPAAADAAARRRQLSAEVQRRAMALATILEPLLIVAWAAW
jgi:general secretion pathway protein F